MATLNVAVVDQSGAPVADQLVTINTFNALDYAQPGIEINPNPRRTGPDGQVNFYSGPPLGGAIMVQATAQNGTTDPVHFDGTTNVLVTVTLIPFARRRGRAADARTRARTDAAVRGRRCHRPLARHRRVRRLSAGRAPADHQCDGVDLADGGRPGVRHELPRARHVARRHSARLGRRDQPYALDRRTHRRHVVRAARSRKACTIT